MMRPTAPGFRIFFSTKTCFPETLPDSMCFFNGSASCVQGDCKFKCDVVDRAHIACFFQRKCASQESCCLPWVHFPCVFSGNLRRALRSDCEFTCDAANGSLSPNIFPRKTRLAGGIPPGSHCHCKCSFVPKPGRKPNLDKGTLYRRCRVI